MPFQESPRPTQPDPAAPISAVREVKQALDQKARTTVRLPLSETLARTVVEAAEGISALGAEHQGDLGAVSKRFEGLSLDEAETALVHLLDVHDKREVLLAYRDGALLAATMGPAARAGDAKATAPLPLTDDDDATAVDLAGAVVTHTHPGGSPLSKADVSVAIDRNLQEIRATGRNGTFSLKRPAARSDWGLTVEAVAGYFAAAMGTWRTRADLFVKPAKGDKAGLLAPNWLPRDDPSASKQGACFAEDNCMQEHFALLQVAKQSGAIYSGPGTAELAAWRIGFYERRQATGADSRKGFGTDYIDQKKLGAGPSNEW